MRSLQFCFLVLVLALIGTGCVRKVTVSQMLPLNREVSTDELVNRINSYAEVQTFSAQSGVVVRNYFTGNERKAQQFPEGNGAIRFRRPENIRMRVSAPVIGSTVADMVSDGSQFRLAIHYPSKHRQFVFGSNQIARLAADDIEKRTDQEISEAGGLLNMRPQHVTDAFLIKPTTVNDQTYVFREEVLQEEREALPGKKARMVIRGYYVVHVIERIPSGVELRRKFWFDRTKTGTPLVRQQTFENGDGRVGSDISYSDWFPIEGSNRPWPRRVVIDRRNDGYALELILERGSVEINADLPATTFVLENTENLKEVNLDVPRKASALREGRPQTH